MNKKLKKILGWFLLGTILPIMSGIITINGKLCYYGHCENVIPFWGGYLDGITIVLTGIFIIIIGYLIINYLIFDNDGNSK